MQDTVPGFFQNNSGKLRSCLQYTSFTATIFKSLIKVIESSKFKPNIWLKFMPTLLLLF